MPLLLSVALHLLAGVIYGRAAWLVAPSSPPTPPPSLRFEIVDTPESAAAETPPENAEFQSTRATRSQQPTPAPPDAEPTDRPRILEPGEGHDLRPVARAAERALQPEPAPSAVPPAPALAPAEPSRSGEVPPDDAGEVRLRPATESSEREPAPAVPPRPEVAPGRAPELGTPSEGRRAFTPAEQDELARAEATGEFSYAATQHFFAEYLLALRNRVDVQWSLQLVSEFLTPGAREAVVDFLVLPDGSVSELQMRRLEGGEGFATICTRSIRRAAPFGPIPYDRVPGLPESLTATPIRIRFTFTLK